MPTEKDLPAQFASVKDDNENFIWIGEPLFIPFLCTGIPFLIIGLIWGAFDFFLIGNMKGKEAGMVIPFMLIHLFPFYLSIFNMIRLVLVHKNTFYAITNKRVMMRSGFWGIDFKSIDFDKIQDLGVSVNPIENMFSVGSLRFFTGNLTQKGARLTDNFVAIENPYEVYKKLKTVSVDVKTDWNYPNKLRPDTNPGYGTSYKPNNPS